MEKEKKKRSVYDYDGIFKLISTQDIDGGSFCLNRNVVTKNIPEIERAMDYIASLISLCSIKVFKNIYDDKGNKKPNKRIRGGIGYLLMNGPDPYTTKSGFLKDIIYDLLTFGNSFYSIEYESTTSLDIKALHRIDPERVNIIQGRYKQDDEPYTLQIDGKYRSPSHYLHFKIGRGENNYTGKGKVSNLKDNAYNLAVIENTIKNFLEYGPKERFIINTPFLMEAMDNEEEGMNENFAKAFIKLKEQLRDDDVVIIPSEGIDYKVIQSKNLSDLNIKESKDMQIQTVSSSFGIPKFVLDASGYNQGEYNAFIKGVIDPICKSISEELTKKLTYEKSVFIKIDTTDLYDLSSADRQATGIAKGAGILTVNEARVKEGVDPIDEEWADEIQQLENYIPAKNAGDQKKLTE